MSQTPAKQPRAHQKNTCHSDLEDNQQSPLAFDTVWRSSSSRTELRPEIDTRGVKCRGQAENQRRDEGSGQSENSDLTTHVNFLNSWNKSFAEPPDERNAFDGEAESHPLRVTCRPTICSDSPIARHKWLLMTTTAGLCSWSSFGADLRLYA
jgi:hypothetical protein